MSKPKSIQDTAPDAFKMRNKSGIDKRVAAGETEIRGRIGDVDNRVSGLTYNSFGGSIPSRAYAPDTIPGSAILGMGASRLTGSLPSSMFANDSVPPSALIGIGASKITGTLASSLFGESQVPGSSINSLNGSKVVNQTLAGSKIIPGTVGGLELQNSLFGGNLNSYKMRRIQTVQLGGNSEHASSANHFHSVPFKELPRTMREKIISGRERLHSGLIPAGGMTGLGTADLGKRIWLLERLMAAVLHMELDDPYQPTSTRENHIASGEHHDVSLLRYPGGEQEYRGYHPEASALFDSFDVAEIAV